MQELELTEKLLKEIEYIEKLQEAEEFDVRNLQVRVVEFTHYFVVDYQKGAYSDRHLFDLKNKFVDNGS